MEGEADAASAAALVERRVRDSCCDKTDMEDCRGGLDSEGKDGERSPET